MKRVKEFILLVKTELAICLAVPILTAVLLTTDTMNSSNTPLFMIGLFCFFAYGVVKMILVLKADNTFFPALSPENETPHPKGRLLIGLIAIILPLAGLQVNSSFISVQEGGIFGDFSSPWFYIIAVLNGLVMLAPIRETKLGLGLFYLKIVGYTFIIYFTIIFMPYLPFALIGILIYGLGLLILVPLIVFIIETVQIIRDVQRLQTNFKTGLLAAALCGLLTLPSCIAVDFALDKSNFNDAMQYMSAAAGTESPTVNLTRLEHTLTHINNTLNSRTANPEPFENGNNTPIISRLYQLVVLEDKLLSPDTSQRMHQIFLRRNTSQPLLTEPDLTAQVDLLSATAQSEYDQQIGAYKTWVDLEIINNSPNSLAEYRTEFTLPDGCFIGDYYLYVGAERKQGILADKRAALITYNTILRTSQDPGLIYYKGDNTIELRVYPFSSNEIRKTGFLVWHSQRETITIDGRKILLAAVSNQTTPLNLPGISFIPAAYKKNLSPSERQPKYYFVVDAGRSSPYGEHLRKVADYRDKYGLTDGVVLAASYRVYDPSEGITKGEGGFNLPLAMEWIFRDVAEGYFPVIITVSDNIYAAPEFQNNHLAKRFPESPYYYNLGYDLSLTPYSFADNKRKDLVTNPIFARGLMYNDLVVAADDRSEVILVGDPGNKEAWNNTRDTVNSSGFDSNTGDSGNTFASGNTGVSGNGSDSGNTVNSINYPATPYENAFFLQAKSAARHYDHSAQIEQVRDSFRQRILTRHTAFTVLETIEQEQFLLDLQAKFLNEDASDAPAVMMSEPGMIVFVLSILFLLYWVRRARRNHKLQCTNHK